MENVWSIVVSKIYSNNQYYRKEELINAINKAANEIEEKMILNLYESIPNRLIKIIESNGAQIDY